MAEDITIDDIPIDVTKLPMEIDVTNEYNIRSGRNLDNHSATLRGFPYYVRQHMPDVPMFRTRQSAYRYAAYLIELAGQHLPNEQGAELHDFEAVHAAIIERGVKQ